MNKIMMAAGAAALLAGCGPELAEVPYGSKEAHWQETLRQNYSGYEAPRTAPPAIVDNVSPKLIEEEQLRKGQGQEDAPAAAADDPAVAVDKAAEKEQAPADAVDKAAEKGQPADAAKGGKDSKEQSPADAVDKAAEKGQAPEADKAQEGRDARDAEYAADGNSYEVQPGDNLSKIAKKFYGDARRYDVIVKANPQLGSEPNKLRVGMKLLIPKI